MPETERISIWSIAGNWLTAFYILFSIEVTIIVALVAWREIVQRTDDTAIETAMAIGTGSAPNIFTAAAINIAILFQAEVTKMLAERYLKRRFEEGKEEGKAEGFDEGFGEGRADGRELERKRSRRYAQKLRAWNQERLDAAEKGEPFDKPMPELDDEDDE